MKLFQDLCSGRLSSYAHRAATPPERATFSLHGRELFHWAVSGARTCPLHAGYRPDRLKPTHPQETICAQRTSALQIFTCHDNRNLCRAPNFPQKAGAPTKKIAILESIIIQSSTWSSERDRPFESHMAAGSAESIYPDDPISRTHDSLRGVVRLKLETNSAILCYFSTESNEILTQPLSMLKSSKFIALFSRLRTVFFFEEHAPFCASTGGWVLFCRLECVSIKSLLHVSSSILGPFGEWNVAFKFWSAQGDRSYYTRVRTRKRAHFSRPCSAKCNELFWSWKSWTLRESISIGDCISQFHLSYLTWCDHDKEGKKIRSAGWCDTERQTFAP